MNITLTYKYIKHDVDQWTYRLGNTSIEDPVNRSQAQTDGLSPSVSFCRRKIEEALNVIKSKINNRITIVEGDSDDTITTDDTSWNIELTEGVWRTDSRIFSQLLHRFVVRSVVRDWCEIYVPVSVNDQEAEVTKILDDIIREVYRKKEPILFSDLTVEEI